MPEVDLTCSGAGQEILNGSIASDLSTITATLRRGERFAIVQSRLGRPWAPRTVVEDEFVDFPVSSADGARVALERDAGHRLEGGRSKRTARGPGGWRVAP